MKLLTASILFVSFLSISSEKLRFDNNRVYSMKIENEEQLKAVRDLEKQHQSEIFYLIEPISASYAEIVIPPHKFADVTAIFDKLNIEHFIKVQNLQKLIDEEQPPLFSRKTFGWDGYYDLPAIYDWLDERLKQYPDILTHYEVGTSYENRTIRAVKLSKKKNNSTIFIESTIHSNEWITVATVTYILNTFLTTNDPEVQALAESYDWIFVPVVNVDGYSYTHSTNRMWRKTRQPYGKCVGADPNRNWDFHFNDVGSSPDPCSSYFAGPKAFSEPETRALSNFIKSIDKIDLYLAFHCYSQLLLFPYGHTTDPAPNRDDLLKIGKRTIDAIAKRYGTEYKVGDIASTIYMASGSSLDWAYAVENVPIAFGFELRPNASDPNGAFLPADQIIPNSKEVIDGLIAMVKEAKELNYL